MANKRNYQKELDAKIAGLHGEVPTLLLHSCCAPCSSYVLEYLSQYFSITLFYYNPNIYPPTEYEHRVEEQQRLIHSLPAVHPISFCPGPYDSDRFYELTRGMENVPEAASAVLSAMKYGSAKRRNGKAAQTRLFYNNPLHQPAEKRGKAE